MSEKIIESNRVTITGMINSGFTFSHEVYGEKFYYMDLLVKRISDTADTIVVLISERLIDVNEDYIGEYITVKGQFRSFNKLEDGRSHLLLYVFVRSYVFAETNADAIPYNAIHLDGFICKNPVYRKTPLGREITDIILAVNRPYRNSDYIPCICWGRNARFVADLEIGSRLRVDGRIQSRNYFKKHEDGTIIEQRTAYEISVSNITVIEE